MGFISSLVPDLDIQLHVKNFFMQNSRKLHIKTVSEPSTKYEFFFTHFSRALPVVKFSFEMTKSLEKDVQCT